MQRFLFRLALPVACLAVTTLAYGQGGSSTAPLSGVVVDSSGAGVPGASVTVTNSDTGSTYSAVTGAQGTFTVPALQAGTYSVKVSMQGFKQAIVKDVKLLAATPGSVRVALALGGLEESIVVEGGGSPLVQTQSAAVSTTIEVNQIKNLPVQSRNALDFLTSQPGIQTSSTARNSIISGLDQSAINITIDGMSVQDNYLKTTDGYFARLSPRLDAVEEVTLTTAGATADASGQGGVQIRFITRGGTNQYHGSAYEYFRRDGLNANTWFNNRDGAGKARLKFDNYGIAFGGPIRIPGLFDGRDKAFFFINYEESRQPADTTRNRIILSPSAQQGIFQYNTAGGVQSVDLLQLAAANGQLSTVDPTIAKLLKDIRNSTASTGGIANQTDPLVQQYTFRSPFRSVVKYPTVRLDVQLTQKHRVTATYTLNQLLSNPDTLNNRDVAFPGFPIHGVQDSKRFAYQGSVRSTLTPTLVNDFRFFGATGGATLFSTEINPSLYSGTSVADQAGFDLNLGGACCGTGQVLTNAAAGTAATSSREASTQVAHDVLTWVRDTHSFTFGAEFTQVDVWLQNQTQVPRIEFGVANGDPAQSLFSTANFPGASTTTLNNARALYAILTGRVSQITGNARLDEITNQYTYLGSSVGRGRMREFDFFAHDAWRARSNLTLNYGLRYVLQLPIYPLNDSYSTASIADIWGVSGVGNLFKPGVLTGQKPQFNQFKAGTRAYNISWKNFAPDIGVAWHPSIESGLLRAILGSEPVLRGGFSIAYSRDGMSDFTGLFGANPGISIDASRSQTLGNLGTLPLLLRNPGSLGAPSIQAQPQYPLAYTINQSIQAFDPNLKIPYSESWSAGIQRRLGKSMAIEARYVGTRGLDLWTDYNVNESNIISNGFLNEFRLAQANLQANIAAGRGSTFRYFGPGTGTSPLPIYLAYFNGIPTSRSSDPSLYTSPFFSNSNFVDPLAIYNPQPFAPAGFSASSGLDGDPARRANALAAGLPVNFFRANPDLLNGAFIRGNGGGTRYNALEVVLRRHQADGLYFDASYSFSKSYDLDRFSLRSGYQEVLNVANTGNTIGGTGGVTHAFKLNTIWELPFGKGKWIAGNAGGLLDRIIGGWQVAGTARIQSGRLLDFGNVRLVGMTRDEFSSLFRLRFDNAGRKIYMLPQDVIDNTIKAFGTSATSPTGYSAAGPPTGRYLAPANGPDCIELVDPGLLTQGSSTAAQFGYNYGPGTCGTGSLVVTGPAYWTSDVSLVKRIPLKAGVVLDLRAELLNAFNHANFIPRTGGGTTAGFRGTTSSGYATSTAFVVNSTEPSDGRVAQLVARITW